MLVRGRWVELHEGAPQASSAGLCWPSLSIHLQSDIRITLLASPLRGWEIVQWVEQRCGQALWGWSRAEPARGPLALELAHLWLHAVPTFPPSCYVWWSRCGSVPTTLLKPGTTFHFLESQIMAIQVLHSRCIFIVSMEVIYLSTSRLRGRVKAHDLSQPPHHVNLYPNKEAYI